MGADSLLLRPLERQNVPDEQTASKPGIHSCWHVGTGLEARPRWVSPPTSTAIISEESLVQAGAGASMPAQRFIVLSSSRPHAFRSRNSCVR